MELSLKKGKIALPRLPDWHKSRNGDLTPQNQDLLTALDLFNEP